MRGLWRNAGFRRELLAYLAVGAVFTAAGFAVNTGAGTVAAFLTMAIIAVYAFCAARRYRAIGDLAGEVDRILHGDEDFSLDRFSEGELSILHSEISKLVVTLRRQSETLRLDKIYLSDSLADISHQLKTPLTSLNLASAMLAEPGLEEGRRIELAREVSRELERIDWLVSSLLKMSRLDAGTAELSRTRLTVGQVVSAAAEPLTIPMEVRGVALRRDFEGTEAFTGDGAWTAEAIGNLLKNCMEHTPAGGVVTVSASENALYTEIIVCDTGPGFDEGDLPHIFERFYRGKNADPGSVGIGLALARMIITSSGGTIKADNRPGGGARFTVRFFKSAV